MNMRNSSVKAIALGGILTAMATAILCMSGIIPIFTYASPVLCMVISAFVLKLCPRRLAWACYIAVALLGLLLCADKEASAVYAFLGYYPLAKPQLDKSKFSVLFKILIFNGTILLLYFLLMNLLGLQALAQELHELGTAMLILLLILSNALFFLLDSTLDKLLKRNIHITGQKS